MKIMLFLSFCVAAFFCSACVNMQFLSQVEVFEKISFETIIVNNPGKINIFYCRPFFKKGTSEGHYLTKYNDMAAFKKPVILKGILKDSREIQKELVVCGLMEQLNSGSGLVSRHQDLQIKMPLLDMREPMTISLTNTGIFNFTGMPHGLPQSINEKLKPGESLLLCWFVKNLQLTLVRLTFEKHESKMACAS